MRIEIEEVNRQITFADLRTGDVFIVVGAGSGSPCLKCIDGIDSLAVNLNTSSIEDVDGYDAVQIIHDVVLTTEDNLKGA